MKARFVIPTDKLQPDAVSTLLEKLSRFHVECRNGEIVVEAATGDDVRYLCKVSEERDGANVFHE